MNNDASVRLLVTAGPFAGQEFTFEGRDSFLVGRSEKAHLKMPMDDPYFSRQHFTIEFNPPRCRLMDLGSRNGVYVNGEKAISKELRHGDTIKAGHTEFRVEITGLSSDDIATLDLPKPSIGSSTTEYPEAEPFREWSPPGFEIHGQIGHGGMGVVYRAVRQSDGVAAALKIIRPTIAGSRKQIDRFLREARILGQLQHANVVRFLEAGEADGKLFIAMELVQGIDAYILSEREGPLSVARGVRLMCQALRGIEHAHAKGFVHRDIKPANLLIEDKGASKVVKVADFGLARVFETSQISGLTLNGEHGGTVKFMPPEQITHYREMKPAGDQYSAAATLYYLLTGQFAFNFPGDSIAQMVMIHSGLQVPIQQRRPNIPDGLAAAIGKALNRDQRERFDTVSAFRDALLPFANWTEPKA